MASKPQVNNPFLSAFGGDEPEDQNDQAGLNESDTNTNHFDLNEHGDLDVSTQGDIEVLTDGTDHAFMDSDADEGHMDITLDKLNPMIGHNSQAETETDFEVRALTAASEAGKLLGQAGKQAEKASNTVATAETLREQAADTLYPVLEEMGVDREWGKDFARKAKEIPLYNTVRDNLCRAMSTSLKDLVEETDKGPKFSGRVLKAFSRFVTSYRENGKGGQTEADKAARAAEKERTTLIKGAGKAYLEDILPLVRDDLDGNIDTIKTLLASHAARFPEV